jgi:hypothetical protein
VKPGRNRRLLSGRMVMPYLTRPESLKGEKG